jgi:hypothetical protein
MSSSFWRGEMAPLTERNDGNENQAGFNKYKVLVQFDGSEFYCRATINHRDWNWRALSLRELRRQVSVCFPNAQFRYELSRSAALANDPREILRG